MNEDDVYKTILYGSKIKIKERIIIGILGVKKIDYEAMEGCYSVQWFKEPYTLQEHKIMIGYIPPQNIFSGEIIYDVAIWNQSLILLVDKLKRKMMMGV